MGVDLNYSSESFQYTGGDTSYKIIDEKIDVGQTIQDLASPFKSQEERQLLTSFGEGAGSDERFNISE